ncbi:MAG: hypothetical protein HY393_02645 [Candidatus Diapherotrites archaeon]|nr:hypothetical protein [Candidatus Diapherotrites archaeon]
MRFLVWVACLLVLSSTGLAERFFAEAREQNTVAKEQTFFTACDNVLSGLHADAASALGYEPPPVSKVVQVSWLGPDYVKYPVGAILFFEDSPVWYGKQFPFDQNLKWGFGDIRKEGLITKLVGLIIPIGGTIADFQLALGVMTPFNKPMDNAEESGLLVFTPADPASTLSWVYVYDIYSPENWPCP